MDVWSGSCREGGKDCAEQSKRNSCILKLSLKQQLRKTKKSLVSIPVAFMLRAEILFPDKTPTNGSINAVKNIKLMKNYWQPSSARMRCDGVLIVITSATN